MALTGIAVRMEKRESGKDVRKAKEKLASGCYREEGIRGLRRFAE
jgi:hypothetical protein